MQFLARHALEKDMKENILSISKKAREAKKINNKVIDGTVGMILNEDLNLYKYSVVEKLLKDLKDEENYFYAPTGGEKNFKDAVLKWVFNDSDSLKNYFVDVIPTPGASGALSNAIFNYVNKNESILISEYFWDAYTNMALDVEINVETFKEFTIDYKFNLPSFKSKVKELISKQNKLFYLLNDPCNNPTGYSLTLEDVKGIVKVLNEASKKVPVVLLLDIAYFDYTDRKLVLEKFNYILDNLENVLFLVAASGSKSFSLYGYRIGAVIGLSKNKVDIDDFNRVMIHSARSRWSCVSRPGISVIEKIFNDKKNQEEYFRELNKANEMLKARVKMFNLSAKKYGLKTIPYGGGFFIAFESEKEDILDELKKDNVYVIKLGKIIRIAISSVSLLQIDELVQILKKHQD